MKHVEKHPKETGPALPEDVFAGWQGLRQAILGLELMLVLSARSTQKRGSRRSGVANNVPPPK